MSKKLAFYLPALLGYAIHIFLHLANDARSTFQDDMRQHILGLQPTYDFFGLYFNSTVPFGIGILNKFISLFVSPLQWARWGQPLLIALLATFFSQRLGRHLFREEKEPFLKTFLLVALVQAFLWSGDDLISSTPRSWAVLCVLAMLEAIYANHFLRLALVVLFAAIFYSPLAILGFGLLLILGLENFLREKSKKKLLIHSLILLLSFGFLLSIAIYQSDRLAFFGPTITKAEAIVLPEFNKGGRAVYFSSNPWEFYFTGSRSGLMTRDVQAAWLLLGLGILYGLLKSFFTISNLKQRKLYWLLLLLGSGLFLFFLAHAFWFRLFHPNRYVQFIIPVIAVLIIVRLWNWRNFFGICLLPIALFLINYALSNQNYHKESDAIWIQEKVKVVEKPIIATFPLSQLGDALPILIQVPIVASVELSLPYHQKFYQMARERLVNNFNFWTTTRKDEVHHFLETYKDVTHILLEHEAWLPKTKLPEPWQTLYHAPLTSSPEPLLKHILDKGKNEKKKLLSKEEFLEEIDKLTP